MQTRRWFCDIVSVQTGHYLICITNQHYFPMTICIVRPLTALTKISERGCYPERVRPPAGRSTAQSGSAPWTQNSLSWLLAAVHTHFSPSHYGDSAGGSCTLNSSNNKKKTPRCQVLERQCQHMIWMTQGAVSCSIQVSLQHFNSSESYSCAFSYGIATQEFVNATWNAAAFPSKDNLTS